jgi:branched-chain amino acid transport system substrate-binding protein
MHRRKGLLLAGLFLIASVLFAACNGGGDPEASVTSSPSPSGPPPVAEGVTPGPGVSDTQIRLGMTNDLTVAGNTPYGAVTTALQAYFVKVNLEDGGVCGRDLYLVARDDQYNPDLTLAQTRALVEQDQVLAVIGGLGTKAQALVAPYLNDPNADGNLEDGVPQLYLSTGYSGWGDTASRPWTIGFIPDYQSDAQILAKYINENLAGKRIGILYQNDEFGNDYLTAIKAALPDPGLLVSEQPYDPAAPVDPFVANFVVAQAEVAVLATPPEVSAPAINAAHAQGYMPKFVLSYVNSFTQLAMLVGGGAAADQLAKGIQELAGSISTQYLLSAVENERDPALIEHERIMQTYGGPAVSTLTIYAQSLGETIIETLARACHTPTRRGIMDAAQSVQDFHPTLLWPGVNVNVAGDDHRAIQSLQTVEFRPDGTVQEIGEPLDQ